MPHPKTATYFTLRVFDRAFNVILLRVVLLEFLVFYFFGLVAAVAFSKGISSLSPQMQERAQLVLSLIIKEFMYVNERGDARIDVGEFHRRFLAAAHHVLQKRN